MFLFYQIEIPVKLKGLYLYGEGKFRSGFPFICNLIHIVGTGKTMLMDIFFHSLPSTISKRRVHFHDFITELNTKVFKKRKLGSEAVPFVGKSLAHDSNVLCFDEFQFPDVASANLLSRLITYAIGEGLVIVATSNMSPKDVCTKGLHNNKIGNFLEVLEKEMVIHRIGTHKDYRKSKQTGR